MIENKTRLLFLVIPLAIIFVAVGIIGLYSSSYLSVSDLKKFGEPVKVSVMGNVSRGSVRVSGGAVTFVLTDDYYSVKVYYPGAVTLDNSTSLAQVTVEGIYYPELNLINATNILYKCPSKQQMEEYNQSPSE